MTETDGTEASRRPVKSEAAFRTISEVSVDLDVPQHVLRFWEGKFPQIKPLKRGGGRRYYRPEDVALLRRIRDLLYKDGYTIRGVQKLLREQTRGGDAAAGESVDAAGESVQTQPLPPPHPEDAEISDEDLDLPPPPPETPVEPPSVAPLATAVIPADITPQPRFHPDDRAELQALLEQLEGLHGLLAEALEARVGH